MFAYVEVGVAIIVVNHYIDSLAERAVVMLISALRSRKTGKVQKELNMKQFWTLDVSLVKVQISKFMLLRRDCSR